MLLIPIYATTFGLYVATVLWLVWFQKNSTFSYKRLHKVYFVMFILVPIVAMLETGDLRLLFCFAWLGLATLTSKSEVRGFLNQGPATLSMLPLFLCMSLLSVATSYEETGYNHSGFIFGAMGTFAFAIAIVGLFTARKSYLH
jgi:hypothetical protein